MLPDTTLVGVEKAYRLVRDVEVLRGLNPSILVVERLSEALR